MRIPEEELNIRAIRSSGPGGQHVNKTSTKIEVRWNLAQSPSLNEAQRTRLLNKLASRLDKEGIIRLTCDETRSQLRNKEIAIERLHKIVNDALAIPKRRKKTKPTRGSNERKLAEKARRGQTKQLRRKPTDSD